MLNVPDWPDFVCYLMKPVRYAGPNKANCKLWYGADTELGVSRLPPTCDWAARTTMARVISSLVLTRQEQTAALLSSCFLPVVDTVC